MTKQRLADRNLKADGPVEIEVTERMVSAGLEELSQHQLGCDLSLMLENVFRAMFYAR